MNTVLIFILLAHILLAQGSTEPDLRGIWQVRKPAETNLEAPKSVIVDPPNGKIPYRPDAIAKRQENFKNRATADPKNMCFQPGVPRAAYTPKPLQIFQTSGRVVIVYQDVHAYRVIFTDGRPHYDEGIEFYMGDSRGHWEGNSLVVNVTNFKDETWLDMAGNYHSDALHVVERYTRSGSGTINYEATIEDSKVFTRPWKISMPLFLHTEAGAQILEDECVKDDRGVRRHTSPFRTAK